MSEAFSEAEELRLIYVTCASLEESERIGEILVAERLVACVNLIPGMTSIYRWQGKVERGQEVVLVAKTTLARTAAVTERIIALHCYEVPCIVALPILAGNPGYLSWLRAAVQSDEPRP